MFYEINRIFRIPEIVLFSLCNLPLKLYRLPKNLILTLPHIVDLSFVE